VPPSAKSDASVSTIHSRLGSKCVRIGAVVKQCFSFSNDYVMASVHIQSFGDPFIESLRGFATLENPSMNRR
jgi:hypothetical protein